MKIGPAVRSAAVPSPVREVDRAREGPGHDDVAGRVERHPAAGVVVGRAERAGPEELARRVELPDAGVVRPGGGDLRVLGPARGDRPGVEPGQGDVARRVDRHPDRLRVRPGRPLAADGPGARCPAASYRATKASERRGEVNVVAPKPADCSNIPGDDDPPLAVEGQRVRLVVAPRRDRVPDPGQVARPVEPGHERLGVPGAGQEVGAPPVPKLTVPVNDPATKMLPAASTATADPCADGVGRGGGPGRGRRLAGEGPRPDQGPGGRVPGDEGVLGVARRERWSRCRRWPCPGTTRRRRCRPRRRWRRRRRGSPSSSPSTPKPVAAR